MTVGLAATVLNGWLDGLDGSWVKLHTGDPGSAGTANAALNTERQQASLTSASGGATTTDTDLVWASVPSSETYSHISFWSASSGGTFRGSDNLNTPRPVTAGQTFKILAGDLDIAIAPVAA